MFRQMMLDKIKNQALRALVESQLKVKEIQLAFYEIGFNISDSDSIFNEKINFILGNIPALIASKKYLMTMVKPEDKALIQGINTHIQRLEAVIKWLSLINITMPNDTLKVKSIRMTLIHAVCGEFNSIKIEDVRAFLKQESVNKWFENMCKCIVINPRTGQFSQSYNYIFDGLTDYIEKHGLGLIRKKDYSFF